MQVDSRALRFAAAVTTVVLALVLVTGSVWLLAAQAVVFALGVLGTSPYGMIFKGMVKSPPKELEDAGVERIDPTGAPFDPSQHEAVSTVPAPDRSRDQQVSATFQPGYRFKGVLVRPARVQVYSDQGQH